jgi:uncharacterized membrane protein (UPF0127 family)
MVILSVKILSGLREKSKGLIGVQKIEPIFFTTRWGIHTYGVLSPIDVLILDNNHRVVKIRKGFLPNRIFFWNPKYENVVELPAGTIAKKEIAAGSIIELECSDEK